MPWFYAKNREQKGPLEDAEFDRLIVSGEIQPTDLVWQPGQASWLPLAGVRPAPPSAGGGPPPIASALPSIPAPTAAPASVLAQAHPGPTGVGGWLLVFCVLLTIIGPLYALSGWVQVVPYFLRGSVPLTLPLLFAFGSQMILLIASIVVGALIWSGRPDGRGLAQKYLLARLAFVGAMQALNLAVAALPIGSMPPVFWGIVLRVVLTEGLFFLIWWFYFQKSVRVRNTYGLG